MTYQVLARKWRPHNFTEIVGQAHVVKSLINALQHDRLHHAYLFTGTRGVGKTTIARILAKAFNCEDRTDHNPCGQCAACKDVDAGRYLDLIEVDAASRTKVEDTRDLLDNTQYAPNSGKYKVYLIDEVHMLSGHSFNALLKTLEEPPPHVKFLLATTDPQKIPVTVLSRCLQFNLKRLLPDQISGQMEYILKQEGCDFELPALRLLSRAADGSMRDGLSLLDQAIVFGDSKVNTESVQDMLGTIAHQPVEKLVYALAEHDPAGLIRQIAEIAELSPDFSDVLKQLLILFQRVALAQVVPEAVAQDDHAETIQQMSTLFPPETIQLYYQIALIGQRDLELAPDPQGGFEMVMLRMLAFQPVTESEIAVSSALVNESESETIGQSPPPETAGQEAVATQEHVIGDRGESWIDIVKIMNVGGMTRELAHNCTLESVDEATCVLKLDPGHKQLCSSRTEQKLQKAIQEYYGAAVKLKIELATSGNENDTPAVKLNKERHNLQLEAENAIENDENIQAFKEGFDARVIPGTIDPVDDNKS